MSREWEQYRDRYRQRPETFDAYINVWTSNPSARTHFSSWATFSRCGNAEPNKVKEQPHKVRRAEELMKAAGYRIGSRSPRRSSARPRAQTSRDQFIAVSTKG